MCKCVYRKLLCSIGTGKITLVQYKTVNWYNLSILSFQFGKYLCFNKSSHIGHAAWWMENGKKTSENFEEHFFPKPQGHYHLPMLSHQAERLINRCSSMSAISILCHSAMLTSVLEKIHRFLNVGKVLISQQISEQKYVFAICSESNCNYTNKFLHNDAFEQIPRLSCYD